MISSFFSKTKPINYLVTLGFCTALYFFVVLKSDDIVYGFDFFSSKLTAFLFLILTLFSINPIIKANKLAELNSFAILFYVLLLAAFLPSLLSVKVIISNFLIVLSIDKTLALKFDKRIKYKIFEAALLIAFSSILVEWTLVFLLPVYLAVYVYCGSQIRNWLIPIAAIITMLLLVMGYAALFDNWPFFQNHFNFHINTTFNYVQFLGVVCYVLITLVFTFIALIKLNNKGMGRILSLRLLFSYFLIAVLLVFVSEEYGKFVMLYSFLAASIFLANYLETMAKKRLKEALLMLFILTSLLIACFYLFQ